MRKELYFLMLVLVGISLSCSETVVNQQSVLLPLTESVTEKASCEDFFAPVEIIPLNETSNFRIGAVKKIEYFNKEYYVLCNNSKYDLVVFDDSGNIVREIGHWGNGHGEHGQIRDFCIDRKNQRVIALCENSLIITYSLSGEYISKKELSKSVFWNIESLDGYVLCTTNHKTFTDGEDAFLFYIFDENFNLVDKHTNVLPDYMAMFSLLTSPLKKQNNHYVYSDFYMHRIYILDSKGDILQTYTYDKGGMMPSEFFKEYGLFTENQFKYDFILDNIVLNDTILSIYKSKEQVRMSMNRIDGKVLRDFPLKGLIPKLYAVDGHDFLSVCTIEDLERMGLNGYGENPKQFLYIVRYKAKHH